MNRAITVLAPGIMMVVGAEMISMGVCLTAMTNGRDMKKTPSGSVCAVLAISCETMQTP